MNKIESGERASSAGPQGGEVPGTAEPGFDGKGIPMHSRDFHDIPVMSGATTVHIPRHQFTEMPIQHGRPPGEFAGLLSGQSSRDGEVAIAQRRRSFVRTSPKHRLWQLSGGLREAEDARRRRRLKVEKSIIIRQHYAFIVCLFCRSGNGFSEEAPDSLLSTHRALGRSAVSPEKRGVCHG